jgi:hypothetical protein
VAVILQERNIREQERNKLENVGFEVFTAVTMGCVTVKSEGSSVTYRRDALSPSSGSKNKVSNQGRIKHQGKLLSRFDPEDDGSIFLRNDGQFLPDCTVSHPRSQEMYAEGDEPCGKSNVHKVCFLFL